MQHLAGRTALISGASRGIGPYIARALAQKEMNLALAARAARELDEVADQLRAMGVRATAVPADLTQTHALESLVADVNAELGTIDVLVNNAGILEVVPYNNLTPEDIERFIQVNITAPMILTRLVVPGMLQHGQGHIVNISSVLGKVGVPYLEPYTATKAGLIGFTKSLRAEYKRSGVSASVICAGFVRAAGITQRISIEAGVRPSPLVGTASPQDVAQAVVHTIEKDIPEIIVAPRPFGIRLLTGILELFPSLNGPAMRALGLTKQANALVNS